MYLVDGNNVMGQQVGWHRDKRAAAESLARELARLARATTSRVMVVFDGPAPAEATEAPRDVEVWFAGTGRSADDLIVELIKERADRTGLVVVTSDRRLRDRLARLGVELLRSGEFRARLDALRD
jgi:predicted RNA-binding protein with PIN domain